MLEERRIYLEEIEDYANGFYTRDLLTKYEKVQDLKVPRVRNVCSGSKYKKNFSVFGKYLWRILFTPKHFSVNKSDRR
jgi:hypothetical protein